jgi:hypothetical protein
MHLEARDEGMKVAVNTKRRSIARSNKAAHLPPPPKSGKPPPP